MSLQDDILASADIPAPVAVATPEWPAVDGQIFVVRLTSAEVADMWAWFNDKAAEKDALAPYAVVACARAADGTPVFDRDHVKDLSAKAGSAISRIFRAADELNLFTEASRKDIQKN